jgi:glyoxylase-like metal-dependent hydrolase (beta-lactamase superfamily II)
MKKTLAVFALCTALLFVLISLPRAGAQSQSTGAPAVATPTAFPPPGTYITTESVALLCATPGAEIHYTLDGTDPNASSPVFDPYKLLWVGAVNNGDTGLKTGYTIRAIALKSGMRRSEIATFQYTIARADKTAYVAENVLPGVIMIHDYANDKMFVLPGSQKALLIDSGMGTGDLKDFIRQRIGNLPLEVVFTHFHGDHTGQSDQFIDDSVEHISSADRAQVVALLRRKGASQESIDRNLRNIQEGDVIDLGDRKLTVYQVPGHTPGSIVLLEKATGYLFSGDSFGSNGPTVPDAFWLQFGSSPPVDEYLSTLEVFRSKVGSDVKYILTGHNDHPLQGETYLDNLQRAAQRLVDDGVKVLVPSWRPPNYWQVVVGDRMHDPNWASINVNRDKCLSAPPDKLATLSDLQLSQGGSLDFIPSRLGYSASVPRNVAAVQITPTATSDAIRGLKINGAEVKSGSVYEARLKRGANAFAIVVTAADGATTQTYTLTVTRGK